MQHKFTIEIAMDVGVNAAILYDNIQWWCAKNKAGKRNFNDGYYWTYNSVNAWLELFPYLGVSQIKTALKKLESNGYIKEGNYNKSSYDRTKWYCDLSPIHLAVLANGKGDNSQPIPDNKPNSKPKSSTRKFVAPSLDEIKTYIASKNMQVDANKFFDYFEAGNWKDSNGKQVKSWKQKLITWNNHTKPEEQEQVGGVTW